MAKKKPRVCVLRTAGTNCDKETAFAFYAVGSEPELIHINSLVGGESSLDHFQVLALPGGFTYGDDIAAGKLLANELKYKLAGEIKRFLSQGKLIIAICNGFQALVKAGVLPGNAGFKQEASLVINDSAKFEDRWVYLKSSQSKCVWTRNLPEIIYLPVAHGEGKFVTQDKRALEKLKRNNQIVFRYCDERGRREGYPFNPNGSVEGIAGICDETGRVLGLMPHPERHFWFKQHPRWTEIKKKKEGQGMQIFRNGVEYAKRLL